MSDDLLKLAEGLSFGCLNTLLATADDWEVQRFGRGSKLSPLYTQPLVDAGLAESEYRPIGAVEGRTRYARLTELGRQVAAALRARSAA